jgi:hypothetical protein
MTIRTRVALARRAGYLAVVFGLGHFAWAAGIPVLGATRASFDTIGQGGAAHLVTETAVGLLAVLGAVVALALVQPWGVTVSRRPLRLVAWAGTAVAVVAGGYGITGPVLQLLAAVGRYSFPVGHEATAPGWWVFWYALFAAVGIAFTVTLWLTRGRR